LKSIRSHIEPEPDKKIPFQITLEGTDKRYLTGADLNVESFRPIGDAIWIGDDCRRTGGPRCTAARSVSTLKPQ
jgi:hypothetical protein